MRVRVSRRAEMDLAEITDSLRSTIQNAPISSKRSYSSVRRRSASLLMRMPSDVICERGCDPAHTAPT